MNGSDVWDLMYTLKSTHWEEGKPNPDMKKLFKTYIPSTQMILDIGCGLATDSIWLAKQNYKVTAIDFSQPAIDQAQRAAKKNKVKINFKVINILDEKIRLPKFTAVYDKNCFHTFTEAQRSEFSRKVYQLLKKEGYWISISYSDQAQKETNLPTLSILDIVNAVQEYFEIIEIRQLAYADKLMPLAWGCVFKKSKRLKPNKKAFDKAVALWKETLGANYVITDVNELLAAATTTFKTTQKIPAILRPATINEIQECLRIANRYKIPVYPISRGKNYGYGSRVPAKSGCVLIELMRLNNIIEYNENFGFVTVEPGVTQSQLADYLRKVKSKFYLGVTGSTGEASLIGNVLERGEDNFYGERCKHVSALEVILPEGDCIHTGFDHYTATHLSSKLYNLGVGPSVDGLFMQSNLGIVTKMTFFLIPLPRFIYIFSLRINSLNELIVLTTELQKLKQCGVLHNPIFLWNKFKVMAANKNDANSFEENKIEWFGTISFFSINETIGLAHVNYIQTILEKIKIAHTLKMHSAEQILDFLDDPLATFLNPNIDAISIMHTSSFLGAPSEENIQSTYYQKSEIPSSMNPDLDGCGIIFCNVIIPFEGTQISRALAIIDEANITFGVAPLLALVDVSIHCLSLHLEIIYDKNASKQDENAIRYHNTVMQNLEKEGYFCKRLGIHSMNSMPISRDDYGKFIKTLKTSLDPNDILSPGRYDFRKEWIK